MNPLERIKKAGFDIKLVDGDFIEITPADKLTTTQRDFLKSHKAEIITELKKHAELIPNNNQQFVTCGDCLHFKCRNAHGKGVGYCLSGVMPDGPSHWSETPHECAKFDDVIEWVYESDTVKPGFLVDTCYTPVGNPIKVQAASQEHADWLIEMNPKPKRKTP